MRLAPLTGLLLLLSAPAAADDLGPAPEDCPRGAVGTTEHAGEWCAATQCETDADCTAEGLNRQGVHHHRGPALACREVALCVVEEQYTLGGLRPSPAPTATRRIGRGACLDGQCPAGGECLTARRCADASEPAPPPPTPTPPPTGEMPPMPPAAPPPPPRESNSGCAIAPGTPMPGWLALGLLVLVRRR